MIKLVMVSSWTTLRGESQAIGSSSLKSSSPTLNQPTSQTAKHKLGARRKFGYYRGKMPITERRLPDIR